MVAPKPCVLCFSHDYSLLLTRQLLLEKIECAVLCAMGIPELIDRLRWKPADLVLLCQTLTREECIAAQDLAHIYAPKAPCLVMYAARTDCNEGIGTTLLRTSEGPVEFLRLVRKLLPAQAMPPSPESYLPQAAA